MRANQAFPSKYLKSSDVKEKPRVAVISHLAQEMVGQGQDAKEKHVLHFEDQKPLVLNRTNWDALEEAFGDSDDWPGQRSKFAAPGRNFRARPPTASVLRQSSPSRRSRTTSTTRSQSDNTTATGCANTRWLVP